MFADCFLSRYSGVRRQDKDAFPPLGGGGRENKYTPPARRAPTGQATVTGAPVDPAIISSQIKDSRAKKQTTPKPEDNAAPAPVVPKTTDVPSQPEKKAPESKQENKGEANQVESKTVEGKAADSKAADSKPTDKTSAAAAALRPSAAATAAAGRAVSPHTKDGVAATGISATSNVEADVLKSFKTFATQQRAQAEKVRIGKMKADSQVKLQELKKFADNFKLTTPVPNDLISIIAKDPAKQKQIQQKALQNVEEMAKAKKDGVVKDKETPSTSEGPSKPSKDQTPAPASATTAADSRGTRNNAPHNTPSPSGVPNRHGGTRQSYGPQGYHQQSLRNERSPGQHNARGGGNGTLGERIRKNHQNTYGNQGLQQQAYLHDMRMPPTGPANSADSGYGRRLSAQPPPHMVAKLNPTTADFRPGAMTGFAGPSASSSPRSAVNMVDTHASASPLGGQLIRRKTKAIDVRKCLILSHIKISQPAGKEYKENGGLRPSYDTTPTWRQVQDDEKPDSTMHLTYKEYFDRQPFATASATPIPPHAIPQLPHQHQLPFHLQHGANAPRTPHMPPVQMQPNPHAPPMPFNPEDHTRMMHSNSAQNFASPRMNPQMPVYPPQMNPQAQVPPYNQPGMQPFVPGTPNMNPQYRNFSNQGQYMPQHNAPMGVQMMPPPQGYMAAPNMNTMMPSGGQVPMYQGAPQQYMAQNTPAAAIPPPTMPNANGYNSPRQAAAPMMIPQGSQQGQQMYGMNPGMGYQQPGYGPQHGAPSKLQLHFSVDDPGLINL